jgi:SAM-dependent methyltransferase
MEEPAFLFEMGDVENECVLDLGCGDAAFADTVIGRGGIAYVGVDGSSAMIGEARRRNEHACVSLIHECIEDYCGEPDSFDLVASRMALHYVGDLDAVLRNVRNMLVPGGRLIFTVVHPVITSTTSPTDGLRTDSTVDRYFERGPRERQWFGSTVTWHHRTIEDYVTTVQRCGLDFVSLRECEPNAELLIDRPEELERRRRVPLMLLLSARRPSR